MPDDPKNLPAAGALPPSPINTAALTDLASKIGTAGATEDDVIKLLAKGATDAAATLGGIATLAVQLLAKGKGKPKGDDDGEEDDDEGGEGSEGGGDGPGYEDMRMGRPGAPVGAAAGVGTPHPSDPNALDITAFIFETGAMIRDLVKGRADDRKLLVQLAKDNETLREQNAGLVTLIAQTAQANAELSVPLAKAMAETREALLSIPAGGITPRARPVPPKVTPPAADAAFIGGSKRVEMQVLAKAQADGKIDIGNVQHFHRTRKFHTDEAIHTTLRTELEKLVPEVTAPLN